MKCRHYLFVLLLLQLMISCVEQEQRETNATDRTNDHATYLFTRDSTHLDVPPPDGMRWIPGGEFTMGALPGDTLALPYEHPAHRVRVSGFWMDTTEVTNAEFRAFVEATEYVTVAERAPVWEDLASQLPPGTPKPHDSILVAASMVFTPVETANLVDWSQWWSWVKGANWRHPQGPSSSIEGKDDHPVVQVSWLDAQAYLAWKGMRLPTEAEWEFASRGGQFGDVYPCKKEGIHNCGNIWEGRFPAQNTMDDGYLATAPVGSFHPNLFGLYDMAGNVWEWTSDWFHVDYYSQCNEQGVVTDPQGPEEPYDPQQPYTPVRVQRGGSFLCNDAYCSSYRSSARMRSSEDTGQDHAGFRAVIGAAEWEAEWMKRSSNQP